MNEGNRERARASTAPVGKRSDERAGSGERGRAAERLVRDFLVERGLAPLAENWRRRLGELDLVMRERASGTIVFVEVRYRRRGGGLASVERRKRARLLRGARAWLQRHAGPDCAARIDVVGVGPPPTRADEIDPDGAAGPTTALREGLWLEWVVNAVEDDG